MDRAFIRKGHGYVNPSPDSGYEPCTAFDGFEIIAAPLSGDSSEARERRVFRWKSDGNGTCYGAYKIALATDDGGRGLYILMENGSGREVLRVPEFYDGGALKAAILAMPEREQFALLFTIWRTATNAKYEAQTETRQLWARAYDDKRIRVKRSHGQRRFYVETETERDLRLGRIDSRNVKAVRVSRERIELQQV